MLSLILIICKADFDLTGQVLWPAAEVLCFYFLSLSKGSFFDGKRGLELGAGVGVSGLVLSQFCQQVVLTDNNDIVLEILQKNVEQQKQQHSKRS
jgi:methylase of polypeptide subunit release factors